MLYFYEFYIKTYKGHISGEWALDQTVEDANNIFNSNKKKLLELIIIKILHRYLGVFGLDKT